MKRFWKASSILSLTIAVTLVTHGYATRASEEAFRPVGRIFATRCLRCHDGADTAGGLNLERQSSFSRGGDSGPIVVPGDADASLLWQLIDGDDPAMPQDGPPLTDSERSVIRNWIKQGAFWPKEEVLRETASTDRDWWSLRPMVRVPLPPPPEQWPDWARTPIDAFVLDKLIEHDLHPAPPADRRTLIRRVYYDLLGLPPTPEEVDRFVLDPDPLSYTRLVDRLLASPRYGERWARHWLDVVHYGDTHGYDKDKPRPWAWPYRDYVVRSLNDDKTYERFVREQIAGDHLWPDDPTAVVATGFIAAGPWDFIGHAEVPETKIDGQVARNLDRDDMVTSTINTFISTTVQCARCHDHKFDPIEQRHYYALQTVFAALDRADRKYDRSPYIARRRRMLQAQLDELDQERAVGARSATSVDAQREQLKAELAKLPPQETVYAGTVYHGSGAFLGTGPKGGRPREIYILHRGDVTNRGALAKPGTLALLNNVDWRFQLEPDHVEGDRRAALAAWLVRRDHPLTWRSIVNRIWVYHFGLGIVTTPNDFGRMGAPPSHPELLDWLAIWFRDHGQSVKRLHRMILTSAVYQQSSNSNPHFARLDADNRWLWRMNRRALDAESLRDAMLQISGQMDWQMFGPGYQDFVIDRPEHSPHYEYELHDPADVTTHRRSIYRFIVRSQQQPFMQTLDCADPSESVPQRDTTLTAIQALTLLNNRFVLYIAGEFADRITHVESSVDEQVELAIRMALGRPPRPAEKRVLVRYTQQHGPQNLCRLVFNLNEFAFVD